MYTENRMFIVFNFRMNDMTKGRCERKRSKQQTAQIQNKGDVRLPQLVYCDKPIARRNVERAKKKVSGRYKGRGKHEKGKPQVKKKKMEKMVKKKKTMKNDK